MSAGPSELRRHATILIAAAAGVGFSFAAIPPFVLSVFAGPMTREFGWSLQQYQTANLFVPLGILVAAPLGGALLDRYGVRRVALVGIVAYAISIAALSLVNAAPWTFYAAMFGAALLACGTLPTTWTRLVNACFDRQRGVALGIVLSGSGVVAIFAPALAQALIDSVGWRNAWLALALLPLVVAWPLAWRWVREAPASAGTAGADAAAAGAESPAAAPLAGATLAGATLAEALRSRRFWLLAGSFAAVSLVMGGWNANLVPILEGQGLATTEAATLAGVLGLSIAIGRIAAGLLIDRFWAPGVAAIAFALPALGLLALLAGLSQTWMLALAVATFGLAQGAEFDFLAYLVSRFFGLAHYGKIYALLVLPITFATAIGTVVVGRARDLSGGFEGVFPLMIVLLIVSGVLQLLLGRYPPRTLAAAGH
jgi:MFS family permease